MRKIYRRRRRHVYRNPTTTTARFHYSEATGSGFAGRTQVLYASKFLSIEGQLHHYTSLFNEFRIKKAWIRVVPTVTNVVNITTGTNMVNTFPLYCARPVPSPYGATQNSPPADPSSFENYTFGALMAMPNSRSKRTNQQTWFKLPQTIYTAVNQPGLATNAANGSPVGSYAYRLSNRGWRLTSTIINSSYADIIGSFCVAYGNAAAANANTGYTYEAYATFEFRGRRADHYDNNA